MCKCFMTAERKPLRVPTDEETNTYSPPAKEGTNERYSEMIISSLNSNGLHSNDVPSTDNIEGKTNNHWIEIQVTEYHSST